MSNLILKLRYTTSVDNFVRPENPALLPTLGAMDEILQAGSQVISAVSVVEHALCVLIADSIVPEKSARRDFLMDEILGADVVSYGAKRRLAKSLIRRCSALPSASLAELDKALKDLGTYRNAFAHGAIHHTPAGYELHSFDDARRQQRTVDQTFWGKVQTLFDRTYALLDEASEALTGPSAATPR